MYIRQAKKDQCYKIARLYQMAADGVADYIWQKIDPEQPDVLIAGEKRYAREGVDFSYQNVKVLESTEGLVGMMMGFPMYVDPEYIEEDPVLKPYAVLEEDESFYISGVAVFPEYRGRGYGEKLMEVAEAVSRAKELSKVSLIVFENNPAKRLYERLGYKEVNREPIVPHPLIKHEGNALLMVKHLG
jgi:ribosomal protein S18 acetylase RimI-like enzyme